MIETYEYESAAQQRTFDTYNDVDCIHYSGLHDLIKFCKWGYGKVTDHACRELRLKRLTRDQALNMVRQYQNAAPKDIGEFLKWMDMSEDTLMDMVDRFRDPRVWQKDEASGDWTLLHSVLDAPMPENADNVALDVKESCEFQVTPSKDPAANEEEYILMHRGYVDDFPAKNKVTS